MPEGARILIGDTRHGKSPTILHGCLVRYSGIHKSRCLSILGRLSEIPIQDCSLILKTLPEFSVYNHVRHNTRAPCARTPTM
jgi:hypothetical protein